MREDFPRNEEVIHGANQERFNQQETVNQSLDPRIEAMVDLCPGADCLAIYKNLCTFPQQMKETIQRRLKTKSRIDSGSLYVDRAKELAERAFNLFNESKRYPDPQGAGILRNTTDTRPLLREVFAIQDINHDLVNSFGVFLSKMEDDEAEEAMLLNRYGRD